VKDTPRGPQIILSRTHRNFLRRLLENEVPEIYHGIVEIRSIAREPGERAKVAVYATQQGIDPVGACVGIRGVRIQAIVRELHDEKIDVIEWNPDPAMYIAKALSPARVLGVYLNEKNSGGKTATVVVPEDQLSLAIGRDGQNARLAAKLTGWRIDIKSLPEATSDTVHRMQTDPLYTAVAESESSAMEKIQDLLAKRTEGRPLTPEEYDRMAKFVDLVEKRVMVKKPAEKKVEDKQRQDLRKTINPVAFEQQILDSGLPEHVAYTLQENGLSTVGDLIVQMKVDQDEVLRLQGIGPRAMAEINRLVETMSIQPVEGTEPEATEPEAAGAGPEAVTAEGAAPEVAGPEVTKPVAEAAPVEGVGEVVAAAPAAVEEAATPPVPAQEAEPQTKAAVQAGEAEEPVAEEVTFDELFTLRPEVITEITPAEDEEEDGTGKGDKKKGKKKGKKHVEIEYDPEAGRTFVKKKHKRGGEEWGDWG
jgi:N utilization substance protein A